MAKKTGGSAVAESVAVADDSPATADAVTAAVAERTAARAAADLGRWRALIATLADGATPSAGVLDSLAELSLRLRIPASAVRDDLAVLQRIRANEALLIAERAARDKATADARAAVEEIPGLEARLATLRNAVRLAPILSSRVANLDGTIDTARRENPRMFAPAEAYAEEINDA